MRVRLNIHKGVVVAIAAGVAVAGCKLTESEKPIGEPSYDIPDAYQALDAVLDALQVDKISLTYRRQALLERKRKTVSSDAQLSDEEVKLTGLEKRSQRGFVKMSRGLQGIRDIKCEWARLPYKKFYRAVQLRIQNPPVGAYKCTYAQVYNRKYAVPSLQNPEATGYFFKDEDGRFVYAGKYIHPYP